MSAAKWDGAARSTLEMSGEGRAVCTYAQSTGPSTQHGSGIVLKAAQVTDGHSSESSQPAVYTGEAQATVLQVSGRTLGVQVPQIPNPWLCRGRNNPLGSGLVPGISAGPRAVNADRDTERETHTARRRSHSRDQLFIDFFFSKILYI